VKVGPDTRGIGMRLNQSIGIEFRNLLPNEQYRVLTSVDGVSWNDVDGANPIYRADQTGIIVANTTDLGYFAVFSTANIVDIPPTCTITVNPRNVVNGASATLSWTLQNVQTGALSPLNMTL
jgi:hypothetical protein